MTDRPIPVTEGQVIAGKYRVDRVLGTGGMGVVVAAYHLQLGQRVALKFLQPDALGSKEALNRFLREGQMLARLRSPNAARVMDVGTLDGGEPYLVMEYLHGADLGVVLEARGKLAVAEAVGYVLQACEAIAEAHANGIVHRDLKPSNLFLTEGPDGLPLVKVLDFGISKAMASPGAEPDTTVTSTGALVGSPLYMSPEQIRNPKRIDTRTDIWSLGVILYQLLSGITPFEGETVSGALAAIVADAPAPIRTLRADVPQELEEALTRCLDKDPDGRFQSIAELAQALGNFVTAESRGSVMRIARTLGVVVPQNRVAPPPLAAGATTDPGKSTTVPGWEDEPRGPQKARRLALVAAGLVVAAVGLFVLVRSTTHELVPARRPGAEPSVPQAIVTPSAGFAAGSASFAAGSAGFAASSAEPVPSSSPAPSASSTAGGVPSAAPSSSAAPRRKRAPPADASPSRRKKEHPPEDDDGTADRK